LRQRISDNLEGEHQEKLDSEQQHQELYSSQFDSNQGISAQLKALLVKINGQ
jgi:hypothetical protein